MDKTTENTKGMKGRQNRSPNGAAAARGAGGKPASQGGKNLLRGAPCGHPRRRHDRSIEDRTVLC